MNASAAFLIRQSPLFIQVQDTVLTLTYSRNSASRISEKLHHTAGQFNEVRTKCQAMLGSEQLKRTIDTETV